MSTGHSSRVHYTTQRRRTVRVRMSSSPMSNGRNSTTTASASGASSSYVDCEISTANTYSGGDLQNGTLGVVIRFIENTGPFANAYPHVPLVQWGRDSQAVADSNSFQVAVFPCELVDCVGGGEGAKVWGLPLLGAEALTIHRSLGLTLQYMVLDCRGIMQLGTDGVHLFYEGISRTPSLEVLQVLNYEDGVIQVSPKAKAIMQNLAAMAQRASGESADAHT